MIPRQVTLRSLTTFSGRFAMGTMGLPPHTLLRGAAPEPCKGFHPLTLPRFARFEAAYSFSTAFFTSVMNMCPGACVMTNGGFECMTTFCGVTPQGQNTGTSPSRIVTASP